MSLLSQRRGIQIFTYRPWDWNPSVWDEHYSKINLKKEQRSRRQNIEYINFIKRSLEITKIAEQKPRENLSILELGCGSGPLGAEMTDWGYSVEFSDYSDVLIERLRKEFGYKAFAVDCRDLSFAKDNSL